MSAVNYALEHFYYGQLVKNGSPESELQLLAKSPGVRGDEIAEAINVALLPPLAGSPAGSWALVRGRKAVAFAVVQSSLGLAGQSMLHYVLTPPDVLRAMGGNLKALTRLVQDDMPVFEQAGGKLDPIALPTAETPSQEQQIEDILTLMTHTHNRMDTLEALLAAIVQGVPLVVQNAPLEVEARVEFVQGLLALIPPSARFGVTFATHTVPSTQTDAQIRFHGGGKLSRETLVYDWPSGNMAGKAVDDEYSRYIVSQLRLDAELVSKETRGLTAVAAWRIRRGEGLADALGYAAHRLKMDNALLNKQPVETADVSKVLAEDPTLTDELKVAYTQHVLSFALALGDMQHADPIAVMIRQQPLLETALQSQFADAINEGKAGIVYEAIAKWLANPLGPVGMKWVELAHRAGLVYMDSLVKAKDVPGTSKFLESIHNADAGVEVSRIVPKLVEMALPMTVLDRDLNLTVFLLAVNYVDSDVLKRLIASQKFVAQLPPSLGRLTPYLTGDDAGLSPSGLLVDTAQSFGEDWADLILIRLAELAVRAKRPDIVDTSALSAIIHRLASPWSIQYSQTLTWIAKNSSTDETLLQLEPPGPTYLLQIMLAFGSYADLAQEMLHQARLLYPGDRQTEYVNMVRQIFAETPQQVEQVPVALQIIADTGIRSLPLAMAYIGALEGHEWSSELDPVAETVTKMLFEFPAILEVMPSAAMIALLKFHMKRKDVPATIRVAGLLPQVAINEGSKGINLIGRMYKMLDWDERVRLAGLELLRRYVREATDEDARRAITAFGREFGVKVQQTLEATYAMKRMMDSLDLVTYAEFIHLTAQFLLETAQVYADKTRIPSLGAVMNDLDSLSGGLSNPERQIIATEMVGLGKAIIVLADQQKANRPRDPEKHIDALVIGKADPTSVLDVFWVMGGYFTKGKRYALKLERPASVRALGDRSAPMLKDESQIINGVLRGALRAFPPDKKLTLNADAIRLEMDSLWGEISLVKQRELVRDLSTDLQRIADLVATITQMGGDKAMEDGGAARKLEQNDTQPKNPLEMYRFVSGYFKLRAK
ncbi:MAG: hypothetical protein ABI690_05290 [Chloroflexota bacterium]